METDKTAGDQPVPELDPDKFENDCRPGRQWTKEEDAYWDSVVPERIKKAKAERAKELGRKREQMDKN